MGKENVLPPDVLAWPLFAAEAKLRECGVRYTLEETLAPAKKQPLDDNSFDSYVVRQELSPDGTYNLTICRKLRKEVL